MSDPVRQHEILFYTTPDGTVRVDVSFEDETFWLTQKKMAELFGVDVRTINYHLAEIYKSQELQELATIRKNWIVQTEGTREVRREVEFYNLDVIIAVGYRVNSREATQFRIWATGILREFLLKRGQSVPCHAVARQLAEEQYDAFAKVQDRTLESDFEKASRTMLAEDKKR